MNRQISGLLDIRILLVLGVVLLVGAVWYSGPFRSFDAGTHMGMMGGHMQANDTSVTPNQESDGEDGAACCSGMMGSMMDMHQSMHARMHGEAPEQTDGATGDGVSDELDLEGATEQWLGGTRGFASVADRTGESKVVVTVGAGSGLSYSPAAVRVDPGTTIQWEWTGNGGLHDVAFVNGDVRTSLRGEEGAQYTYTFTETGEYRYECTPHASVGMRGVVIVEAD